MTQLYLTCKGFFVERTPDNEYYLIDICDNKTKIKTEDLKNHEIVLDFQCNIEAKNLLDLLKYDIFFDSTNLQDKISNTSYFLLLESKIKECQFIELLAFQFCTNTSLDEINATYLLNMDELLEIKKEGIISAKDFENSLKQFSTRTSEQLLNALLVHTYIQELFEFIRMEIFHSEHRIKMIHFNMLKLLSSQCISLRNGTDIKVRSPLGDAIAYDMEDTVKSMVSALDGIGKVLQIIKIVKNRSQKVSVPNVLHDAILKYKGFNDNPYVKPIHTMYNNLKLLTQLRNDLTHNKSFQAMRQIIFVGKKTPCVLDKNIGYVDILMWDHMENNYFNRAYGFSDFYKEQNNMNRFLKNNFTMLFQLFELTLQALKYDVAYLCKTESNIDTSKCAYTYAYHDKNKPKNPKNNLDYFLFKGIS